MSERDLLLWLIPGFGSVMSLLGMGVFGQLKKMTATLERLSIDIAVIAERVNSHEKRINHLENSRR